ncbi:SOS mutagenesis and repair protein UmuC [Nonlabens spongiae]|uniref:SOS mutagenesis and repair protein UmuC n=1 Tax=Nonlabens spongiae TaxID=331648 RepID=A0A1W6MI33_9FLAO|nr:Y-family DNA polymerase [Nonlabens spongiae]ARN77119.1 SOS mutagenesis and repair protein UmuC [Nonlabens spongiae]
MFALVDCNNFYASCERVFNPALNGKPVVVLSNNDGCVIARSNEAKQLNIKMGTPTFVIKDMIASKRVHAFSSNYALYGEMSARVMEILSRFSPDYEVYSIDEIFIKLEGFTYHNLREYGAKMISKVTKGTGIPISVGIAPTKALAKVANKIAKKFIHKTGGVHVIDSEELMEKALLWTQIDDVWGIGRRYAEKLKKIGVTTARDFTQLPDAYVLKEMTVVGLRLKRDLSGKPTLDLEEMADRKNMAVTRSFKNDITDYAALRERVVTYVTKLAEKLRKQNSCCQSLQIFIHSNPHKKEHRKYYNSVTINLPYATNSTIVMTQYTLKGLQKIFLKGILYKKAGVIALGLAPNDSRQLAIFKEETAEHAALFSSVDHLNKKNHGKIKFAGQDLNSTWKMRCEHLSKRYTTRLHEIITIRCNH